MDLNKSNDVKKDDVLYNFLRTFQNTFSASSEIRYVSFTTLMQPFKGVSKIFLKYFVKFQKTKYDGLRCSHLGKIVV